MERPTSCTTQEAFKALIENLKSLVHSLTNNVYEMDEYDEDAYNSRGENFRDVDYSARGKECYYIPLLEDDFDNHYTSSQYRGQYFDDTSSDLNFNSGQDDEEQDEPTLAQIMSKLMEMQAQQSKDFQFLTSEIQQEKAALKILEAQLAQQVASSLRNPEKFPLQPDVRHADANVITPKSGEVFEDEKRASAEVVEKDEQSEQGKAKEVEEQETPYVAPPAYVPPIPFPLRQIKVPVEVHDGYTVGDVCRLTFFERKVLSDECTKNSDAAGNNLTEIVKKSFHEGPEILICNTRLKKIRLCPCQDVNLGQ